MNKYESNQLYTGNITELAAEVRKELNIEQGVSVKEAFEKMFTAVQMARTKTYSA